jgi:hypothetical protein
MAGKMNRIGEILELMRLGLAARSRRRPHVIDLGIDLDLRRRALRSCGQRRRAQNEQRVARGRNDRVGTALVVAEFDKRGGFVKRLDDSADLATDEAVLGQVAEKRNRA